MNTDIPPAPDWFHPLRGNSCCKWTRSHDSALVAARLFDVDVDSIVALMPDAYAQIMAEYELVEPGRKRACQLTRLNSRRCNQWEDAGKDHSTHPRFDCHARTVAIEHPELGFNPDDTDTPGLVWDLIKAGQATRILQSGPEVAELAATWIDHAKQTGPVEFAEWTDDDCTDDDFADCDCSFDVSEFDSPVAGEVLPDPVIGESLPPVSESPAVELESINANPRNRVLVRLSVDVPHQCRSGISRSRRPHPGSPQMPPMRFDAGVRGIRRTRPHRVPAARGDPLPWKS